MKKATKQSRATAKRKKKQHDRRHLESLRERAMDFEGMSARRVVDMSKEYLERVVSSSRRRRLVSPFDGIALALAAASVSNR